MPSTSSPVAAAIRAELARAGISGRQLARDLGRSPAAIERRLNGSVALRVDELIAIADRLDVPLDRFTEHATPPRGIPRIDPEVAAG